MCRLYISNSSNVKSVSQIRNDFIVKMKKQKCNSFVGNQVNLLMVENQVLSKSVVLLLMDADIQGYDQLADSPTAEC